MKLLKGFKKKATENKENTKSDEDNSIHKLAEETKNIDKKSAVNEEKRKKSLRERLLHYNPLKREEILRRKKERKENILSISRRKSSVRTYLERAGLVIKHNKLSKIIFNICIAINLLISGYFIYTLAQNPSFEWSYVTIMIILIWAGAFLIALFLLWLITYIIIDLKIFKRAKDIEDVFPDFLQLTASNISGGMPIDKALWSAVRPRFGVLAKEIEIVAKATMSGEELNNALKKFSEKYDSQVIKRSINLLTEGMEGGGEIAELLNKISLNMKDTQLMKKEMAANVTNYVIFISFASLVAAPALLALAGKLVDIIKSVTADINIPSGISNINMSLSEISLRMIDYHIFAALTITITAIFTACIIATINKGNVKSGIKYIPMFILAGESVYFLATLLFSVMMAGFF